MPSHTRIAQVLAAVGGLILFAACVLHSVFGYRGVFGALRQTTAPADDVRGLTAVWFMIAWHWAVIGIVALAVAFVRTPLRRSILLLCGILTLADATAMYAALGVFIGNEMMLSSAAAFLAAAGLFPRASAVA